MTRRYAILGAGAAGLCMAAKLAQRGERDFVLYEKAHGVGGTWRDNRYPGAACDVPSMLYCFSFAPKSDWSRVYAPAAEILAYFESIAERYQLGPHLRLGTEVRALAFDEARGVYRLTLTDGTVDEADVVVSGIGQLHVPRVPALAGLAEFAGDVVHTARYPADLDVAGRDVVVVGNAASAVQVVPELARVARRLTVLQRTANWVARRHDRPTTRLERWLFRHVPGLARLVRRAWFLNFDLRFPVLSKESLLRTFFEWKTRREMRARVRCPQRAELLLPRTPIGCNRFLISDDYLETFDAPHVHLETQPIDTFVPGGVRVAGGTEHPADVVVLATGFETQDFLARLDVRGRGGRVLRDVYRDGAFAYLGCSVPGFPNLFQLYGPNTNLGHNSILVMIEAAADHVLAVMDEAERRGARVAEVRDDVMAAYDAELRAALDELVFRDDCQSWYKRADGRVTNNWAYDCRTYEARARAAPADAYAYGAR